VALVSAAVAGTVVGLALRYVIVRTVRAVGH
jgi:hypothetical protein